MRNETWHIHLFCVIQSSAGYLKSSSVRGRLHGFSWWWGGFSCISVVQNDNSPEQQMTHEMLIRNDTGISLNSNPNWFKVLKKSTLDSQLKALKIGFLIQYQSKSSLVHAENKILAKVETFNWLVPYLSRHDVFIGVVSCSKKRQKRLYEKIF